MNGLDSRRKDALNTFLYNTATIRIHNDMRMLSTRSSLPCLLSLAKAAASLLQALNFVGEFGVTLRSAHCP